MAVSSSTNPADYIAIKNTIARYCIALDSKNWELLKTNVFHPDIQGDFPFDHDMRGADVLLQRIEGRLKDIPTQHSLTTQMIDIQPDGATAHATTYFTGLHFGRGEWAGHHLTSWGQYVDVLQLVKGRWLITKRTCLFTARDGDERLMEGLVQGE
ncbi:hypothetical protein PG989_006813 [Apiospora arundinis]|uniref:SnoaL-like domain n=1 Tax=Apiospora arundinis TaxID=335852 RepID=A0ABR2I8B0_9PEZI